MIVSNVELQTALQVGTIAENSTVDLCHKAVESWLKLHIRRAFESAAYATVFDIGTRQDCLLLEDFPVSTSVTIEEITRNASAGWDVAYTWTADQFYTDAEKGIVQSLSGYFPAGKKTVRASYTAGYTAAQITANSLDEIRLAKQIIFHLTERVFQLLSKHNLHEQSISAGEVSISIEGGMLMVEKWMLAQLERPVFV